MRPQQWTKNAFVGAAFLFALGDSDQGVAGHLATALYLVAAAIVLFILASSGVYLLNDVTDIEADRRHPVKRLRPIAAGRVSPAAARLSAGVLAAAGLLGALWLSPGFAVVLAGYVGLQLLYTFLLKRVALLDVFVIAAGFVLRALAGGVVLEVAISPWLLLCTFLLALFLALCKRRHERVVAEGVARESRASLARYDERLLDQLIAVVSGATIVCYAIYTLSPETVEKFGTAALGFTIPFVVFGVFRYLDLVYRYELGDQPERILLKDIPMLATMLLYVATVLGIFALRSWPG
jgi:4-hydroxybenzoate polyprenyltransferase